MLLLFVLVVMFVLVQVLLLGDVVVLGLLCIDVDVCDLVWCIFKVIVIVLVKFGLMILLYLQWIFGNYLFIGLIDKLVGLCIIVNGKLLVWQCDQYNVYVFKVDVFEGVSEIVVYFDFLFLQGGSQGCVVMILEMFNLQWNVNLLYLVGIDVWQLQMQVSVILFKGWLFVIVLEIVCYDGDIVVFKLIFYDYLVDLLLFVGEYYQCIDFDLGVKVLVYFNVFVDEVKLLKLSEVQIILYCVLVQQVDKFYGVCYYNYYEFLLVLIDCFGGIGLEYYCFSENSVELGYFIEWDSNVWMCDLLLYEYIYFWNGKYCCGVDFVIVNFNMLMGDSLLWVYEGQIQFWGQVLVVCLGLWLVVQVCDMLVNVVVIYDCGCLGLVWWLLQDIINDLIIVQCCMLLYCNYQMSEDYYFGGQMLWLEVEGKLCELSGNWCSLDDFVCVFFGVGNGDWDVNFYIFEDVVVILNGIVFYDWVMFLCGCLDGYGVLIGGLELVGWKLVYCDILNDVYKVQEKCVKVVLLVYLLGVMVFDNGMVGDVIWDSLVFNVGLVFGMRVIVVGGCEYSSQCLKDVVVMVVKDKVLIVLLVKQFDWIDMMNIDYYGGLQYLVLECIVGKFDCLVELWKW